jgi:hypothetical protein
MLAGFLTLLLSATIAHATSTVPLKPAKRAQHLANHPTCEVEARFIEARPERKHIVWVFDRLASTRASECKGIEGRFKVWIWEGSFSTLTQAPAYPVYLQEPERGAEVALRLEKQALRELPGNERFEGWFLSSGDSVKAREK